MRFLRPRPTNITVSFARRLASFANQRRGQLLDILVFFGGGLLVGPLSRAVKRQGLSFNGPDLVRPGGRTLGYLLITAFVAHALGAYFKRRPLQSRLAAQQTADKDRTKNTGESFLSRHLAMVIMLATLHFALFFILLGEGWKGAGLQDVLPLYYGDMKPGSGWVAGVHVAVTLAIGVLPTAMAFRALVPFKRGIVPPSGGLQTTELFADVALGFSIIIVTLVWSILILPGMTLKISPSDNLLLVALLVPLLTVPFVLFYITPRALFLVEEYRSPWAWLTIFLAMLPLAKVFVAGTDNGW